MIQELENLLQTEKVRLDEEMQSLQECITTAEKRLHEVRARLRHVEGLLGSNEGAEEVLSKPPSSSGLTLMDLAEEVLREREREPMHYKDLAKEVQSRGGDLAGENAANILVARLVNDERFVRPLRKGFYALRHDYPDARGCRQNSLVQSTNALI